MVRMVEVEVKFKVGAVRLYRATWSVVIQEGQWDICIWRGYGGSRVGVDARLATRIGLFDFVFNQLPGSVTSDL